MEELKTITKNQNRLNVFAENLVFTNSARNAWGYILSDLNIRLPKKILIPSYIGYTKREGSGVFDPINETKTPYIFYNVNENLGFDINEIEMAFKSGQIKLFLVIHYFGFCQCNIHVVKRLCEKYDVYLVEDCAHAFNIFSKTLDLGSFGDFSFYSIHKYFPLKLGGILRINNENGGVLMKKNTFNQFPELFSYDQFKIAKKRRENFFFLQNELKGVLGIQPMFLLEKGIIPHDFPLIVEDGFREQLYFALLELGIPTVALYYQLIDSISSKEFPLSHKISNSILNLPIHQDINLPNLKILSLNLKECLQKIRN